MMAVEWRSESPFVVLYSVQGFSVQRGYKAAREKPVKDHYGVKRVGIFPM